MKSKKTLIILLVFSLALGLLSACGGEKKSEDNLESEFVYLPKYTKIELNDKNMQLGNQSAGTGDKILISAIEFHESDENAEQFESRNINYIYSFDMNNPKLERLSGYEPILNSELGEGQFSFISSNISNMSVDKNGNIYVLESYYASNANENEEIKQGSFIRKLDASGKELLRVESEKLTGNEEDGYLQSVILSPEGKLCFIVSGQGSKLIFADENLKKVGEKQFNEIAWISGSAQSADGKFYLMYYGNANMMVSELDFEAMDLKSGVSVDRNVYNMYMGGGGFDFLAADNANLYGVSAETGKSEYVLGFTNSGIDMLNLKLLITLENGDILALTDKSAVSFSGGGGVSGDGSGNEYEMVYLTKTPKAEAPHVQTLTLAGIYIDGFLSQKILEFNKKSNDLKIEVKDYSAFNTNDDYMAGETKLLTEIGAGNVPDILCSQMSMQQSFIKKGLFIDLLPLIDADKELGGRAALVAPVLNASLTDGKLYTLSAGFRHLCCVAPSDLLPDKIVSLEAARAAKEKLQKDATYFDSYIDGPTFLSFAMVLNQGDFADFKNGKTMFDSQKFIDLLNLSKEMPARNQDMVNIEYEEPAIRVRDGKQLFMLLSNDSDLSEYRMLSTILNGKINFCSLPGSDKIFSTFMVDSGLSISANCAAPELAWKFVRTLVSEVQTYEESDFFGSFPMNAKSFDNLLNKLMEKQMIKDENGNEIEESRYGIGTAGGETIELYALTAEQRDALMKAFDETTMLNEPDRKLMEIINEETAAFFSGSKTAEETAKIIQNRASIYVSEIN